MSFSMFWTLAPPEHSQYSKSYNTASKVIPELRGTLDVIFCVFDACSTRAFSVFKVLKYSLQSDPGAQGYFGCHFLCFGRLLHQSKLSNQHLTTQPPK
jgi:hypothetical protein